MTYYTKQGRRYVPVSDTEALDGLQNGTWLVIVEKGLRTVRRLVQPNYAAVEAAMLKAEEAMIAALRKASEMRPQTRATTPKQRRAWEAWNAIMGESVMRLQTDSAWGIVQAGLEAVRKAMRS